MRELQQSPDNKGVVRGPLWLEPTAALGWEGPASWARLLVLRRPHWRECRTLGSVARVLRSPMIVAGVLLAAGLSAPAEARDTSSVASSVVDRACLPVRAGGYRATNLHAQRLTCRSARTKLRRWLRRGRLPHNSDGWLCYREEGTRICSYLGGTSLYAPNFYFKLRRV